MLQYRLYDGEAIPAGIQGFLKAAANIGSVIGQFLFGAFHPTSLQCCLTYLLSHLSLGYLADALGRKAIYGKELMLIILATILCLTTPTGSLSPDHALYYLSAFRILLGIGVGGDYPMSASVSSDRASVRKRGVLLAYIFANQGWGSLAGSVVTLVVLLCYKGAMEGRGETSKVDGVWRVVVGLSLIPAFGTLYQRLTLPEAVRFEEAAKVKAEAEAEAGKGKGKGDAEDEIDEIELDKLGRKTPSIILQDVEANHVAALHELDSEATHTANVNEVAERKKSHFRGESFLVDFTHGEITDTHSFVRIHHLLLRMAPREDLDRHLHVLVLARHRVRLSTNHPFLFMFLPSFSY